MKKLLTLFTFFILLRLLVNGQELRGVTFGFAAGYNRLEKNPFDYYLTTDTNQFLRLQKLDRSNFVISSVITVKLGKLAEEVDNSAGKTKKVLTNLNSPEAAPIIAGGGPKYKKANVISRLAINIGLNLIEVGSDNVSFNKSIDGGIGLGLFINKFTQIAVSYDLVRIRQLRSEIVNSYENKRIPNGNEHYNALDQTNNNLFYNKVFTGYSIKIIFAVGNQKADN